MIVHLDKKVFQHFVVLRKITDLVAYVSDPILGDLAMPRWEFELPDDWIWKIIMGEYDGAHQSPRTWEE